MLRQWWLSSLICFVYSASTDLGELQPASLRTCPFPMAQNIEPCSCKVDDKFQIHLICNILQDMDDQVLQRLNNAFACKKELYLFDVNLNGNSWVSNFSSNLLGQFGISHFHLKNFKYMAGDIQMGALNGSSFSLKTFQIERSKEENSNRVVETGAFSKLQAVEKILLGNSFGKFQTNSFFDLPSLQELNVDEQTLETMETETFVNLPKLRVLDLSNQSLTSLPARGFFNLSNLTKLNLSKNKIKKLEDNTFYNLPNLVHLDLSKNVELLKVGNMFEHLKNPDLGVNLAETNVKVFFRDEFKPFIETINLNNGKGSVDMSSINMQCTCDVKWLVTSHLQWTGIVKNSSCTDGSTLEQVFI